MTRSIVLSFSAVVLCIPLLFISCGETSRSPVRTGISYTVLKTDEPPSIDGILNDACWKQAETAPLGLSAGRGNPVYPTNVSACYDETMLYIGFECRDLDAASTVREKDGPVENEEYVSVYIDADADTVTYAVISIAPTGAVWDAFVLYREGLPKKVMTDWNCEGIRSSVSVYGGGANPGTEDRFWTVEIAIPLSEFYTSLQTKPLAGTAWRVNFIRRELTGNRETYAFSPTGSDDAYKPESFAWFIFGE